MDLKKKLWSYSSLKLFETCPYAFKLKYIDEIKESPNCFAQHGKFVHSLLERYFKGELYTFELADVFESEYEENITEHFPFYNMYKSFYDKTLAYLQNFDGFEGEVLSVEQELRSKIGGYEFIGFADLIMRDKHGILVIDHKSKGSWKSKKERSEYLKQLYLYAYCIKEMYGEFPYKLVFNRFRADDFWDEELFNEEDCGKAIQWFADTIDAIFKTEEWDCKVDKYYCENLCKLGCVWGE